MNRPQAQFAVSAASLWGCPDWDRIEIALAGRSNVGKSSLLNAIVGIKGLAHTGKTPGRTRALNFFTIGETTALCDLPGYGYAKMAHEDARRLSAMMRDYLERRTHLSAIIILTDARRGPEREELDLAASASSRGVEVIVAATKCDKLKRSERAAAVARFAPMDAEPILCSSVSGEGIEELRRRILAVADSDSRREAYQR
ncbi:MAG TPA: ribosome biogenesis GTP-binding protein YihA/YsxC [Candidatus Binataceae bacterium]|nr:ribosome biogenesis GTP-binding protein YihA/YsxC [Candidatus Binataceae bacterium]